MDNYFEGIDFTKVEILLLIGVFATLLPFLLSPVNYDITTIEKLEEKYNENDAKLLLENDDLWNYQKNEIDKVKDTINKNIEDIKETQKVKIENATYAKDKAIATIEKTVENTYNNNLYGGPLNIEDFQDELGKEEEKFMEVKKEVAKENYKLDTVINEIDLAIYKTLKSEEFEFRISFAFVIVMVILIFSVYLSRKGYTSYTSWLEKLANDKLTFDLKILQHVDIDKLKKYHHKTFKLDSEKRDKKDRVSLGDVKDKDVLEWKPIDENVEWYSVFTEKLDYRFYEEFFGRIYSKWAEKNYYQETGVVDPEDDIDPDPGEYHRRLKRPDTNLYTNPELSPWKNNKQIKEELLANDKKLLKQIFNEIDIFKDELEDKEKAKIEKLLIRKIQIDLLYFSVMINFRRGLVEATEKWMEADDVLKILEEEEIIKESKEKDLSADDLDKSIREIIKNFATFMRGLRKMPKDLTEEELEKQREKQKEEASKERKKNAYEKRQEKIESIKGKMINRNSWNSDDWRAMGSIYYKWREAGKPKKSLFQQFISEFKSSKTDNGEVPDEFVEVPVEPTITEKFWEQWNKHYHGIDPEHGVELDPTELNWKERRTIRAVNSMSKSFGYTVTEDGGKAVLFFGVVFGLIIAVALTNSLDILIGALQTPIDCGPLIENNAYDCFHSDFEFVEGNVTEYQYLIILFLCFFPLGILFYHQGTILLSAKAAEQMTLGSNALIFVNFLFILVQAIVVYFLAASIGDVTSFLHFLIALVIIDAVWVVIFTANDMRDDVRDAPVFIEWILFDVIIALFAGIFLINYAYIPPILEEDGWQSNFNIFAMLLIVLSTRAVVDYSYGWKNFWSKFAGAE